MSNDENRRHSSPMPPATRPREVRYAPPGSKPVRLPPDLVDRPEFAPIKDSLSALVSGAPNTESARLDELIIYLNLALNYEPAETRFRSGVTIDDIRARLARDLARS